jgi:hypothetical protein
VAADEPPARGGAPPGEPVSRGWLARCLAHRAREPRLPVELELEVKGLSTARSGLLTGSSWRCRWLAASIPLRFSSISGVDRSVKIFLGERYDQRRGACPDDCCYGSGTGGINGYREV